MAFTLSNNYFNVQIGSNGEISSLQLTGDTYPTNYVMSATNSPKQDTADHEWVGELMFTYRLGTGNWQKAYTNKSADIRKLSQNGNIVTASYSTNSSDSEGIKNFQLSEIYSLENDYLLWQIKLKNTSLQSIEFGDIGLPLPFNEIWPDNTVIYETQVVFHSFTGNNSSYIVAQRPSGVGPFLLMTPDSTTGAGFEYQDHWTINEHPNSTWAQDQGGWANGLNVFYIHSNVIKSTNRGYLPNTNLVLAPNQEKVYSFKFHKISDLDAMKNKLYTEGLIDVNVVPGMMFATNMTAKLDLHTSKKINSITAQYPSETQITYLTTANDHNVYQIKLNHLGPNNITVNYGNGEKTVLQFYAIEPIDAALQRHATFMVQKTQWNDSSLGYNKVFDDWMMDTKAKRGEFYGYWGWGDDWGLTHGEFLAEKNVLSPVASEISAVDQYLETAIWNTLMKDHHTDYLVHDFYKEEPNDTPTYRGYAYPHIYNTYFSMYKIAKLYPNAVSYIQQKNTYLLRAYNILKALYDGEGVAYNWNTGLMGESTTPEIIQALKDEGYSNEGNDVISKMATKYNNFKDTAYPYGSEYNYDNTGEEACYTLAKMNNNVDMMAKINKKTIACRGTAPVWYYYADPVTICGENWWNFQYTVSLAGYAMDDWTRDHSSTPEKDQRLSYAAKIANIGCINSGQIDSDPVNIGTVSWTYQAEKGNWGGQGTGGGNLHNGWRQMSGEADLGLFGAIRILSSDVAVDPIFGLYGYGCDVSQKGSNYVIIPKDGICKRLHLITQKLSMELERDQYTSATVATAKNYVEFTLKNTTGNTHTTKVTFSGLIAGNYNVMVNDAKVGSFTAKNGQKSIVTINVGTAANYNIRITTGTPTPTSDTAAYYKFDEKSGTTAADSSVNGNHATLNGKASWAAGKNGNAVSFDGTSGYVSLPADVVSNLNDFTISTWVKLNTISDWARIFDLGTGTNSYMFLAPSASGAGVRFAITTNGNGNEEQINASSALATGAWKHVAVTLAGNTGVLYVDGVEAARNNSMTLKPSSLGSTNQNYIGKSQWSDPYLNGLVDEFKIYSRALSASEISALRSSSQATSTDPKVEAGAAQSTLSDNIKLSGTVTNIASQAASSTSFCSSWESISALNDGFDPTSSNDRSHVVYGNWDNAGTTQWVQYDFNQSYTMSKSDIYWFADGQGIDVPKSCVIKYWNGSTWVPVSNPVGLGVTANKYNTTTFDPVTTNKIRLEMTAKATSSTGILEWKVYGSSSGGSTSGNPNSPVVTTPPSWADPFYKKCVYSYNIAILSSNKVNDNALIKAYYILDVMLRKIAVDKPAILQNMIKNHTRVDIVGLTEYNVDLPEWKDWPNKTERRAGGGIDTTTCEEELLVPSDNQYLKDFCVLCHEFTHTILMSGIGDADHTGAASELYQQILNAYNNAIAKNLYTESDYDRTNYHEYFAGQVPRWFNCNPTALNVPNASSISERRQLQIYDPTIYNIIATLFGEYKFPEPWN